MALKMKKWSSIFNLLQKEHAEGGTQQKEGGGAQKGGRRSLTKGGFQPCKKLWAN